MKALSMLLAEFASLAKHKALLFTVIGALFIPVIFTIVQVSATWSPYDQLSNLPVAIVNNDKGTTQDGEEINVGKDLVNDLKGNNVLNWNFVSNEEAIKGLENLDYYLVIEIPEDFSSNLATVLDANPKKMELNYIQNEGLNFFASQVTRSATGQIKEKISRKVTENYTKKLFGNLAEIGDGFQLASDGSKQIFDGATKLNDGTSEMLTSLQEKAGDISKLASGAGQVNDGAVKILTSLNEKSSDISKLASGAKTLEGGTTTLLQGLKAKEGDVEKLAVGAKSLHEGSAGLQTGVSQLLAGLKEASAGATQLEQGTGSLVAGIEQWHGGSVQVAHGASSLSLGLQEFQKAYPGLETNEHFKALVEASKQVAAGSNALSASALEIKAGVEGVDSGVQRLAGSFTVFISGQTQLNTGAEQLKAGAEQLAKGTTDVNSGWKQLISGVSQLQDGTVQLSAGTSSVNTGWQTLTAGVSQLQQGTAQVNDGTSTVNTGWGGLIDGVTLLNDGTGQLKVGSEELYTKLKEAATEVGGLQVSDPNYQMFASPVQTFEERINPLPQYRNSTAPYNVSLALFIGVLAMSLIVNLTSPIKYTTSGVAFFVSKFLKFSFLALIQAGLVSIVTLGILGLEVQSGFQFVLFTMLMSVTFASIVFFFVSLAGHLGRIFVFGFIVLQLNTTGGQLPIELLPASLQSISFFAPLTYSIAGLKSVISLGSLGYVIQNALVLLGFMVIFTSLAALTVIIKHKKALNNNELDHLQVA